MARRKPENEFDLDALPEPSEDAKACVEVLEAVAAMLKADAIPKGNAPRGGMSELEEHLKDYGPTDVTVPRRAAQFLKCAMLEVGPDFTVEEVAKVLLKVAPGGVAVIANSKDGSVLKAVEGPDGIDAEDVPAVRAAALLRLPHPMAIVVMR